MGRITQGAQYFHHVNQFFPVVENQVQFSKSCHFPLYFLKNEFVSKADQVFEFSFLAEIDIQQISR